MQRKLKPKQLRAARLLACGETASAVAERLRIRPETLWRWKQLPEFMDKIERITREEHYAMRYKLLHIAQASVAAVWKEIHNNFDDRQRLQAALGVLKMLDIERVTVPELLEAEETAPEQLTGPHKPNIRAL